ncbi:major facilitator superfamily domain-containing protein [Aspergillus multicolor]|uniref:putative MFS efflux transporter n=1 Tax=Aspergillus multicolor TaxID=41759 RepID=UPI003CCD506A
MPQVTETTPLLAPESSPSPSPSSLSTSSNPPSKPTNAADTTTPKNTFTPSQKRLIILTAFLASTLSPLSSNIYYSALNALATELHVSQSQINLTITTYMICQALSPTLTATLSDTHGRRPAYILCLTLYIISNIALSRCHSYRSLLVFRALQSTGISGTVALSAAVAADIIEPHERGVYIGFTSLGNILAPSLGPVLGGVITGGRFGWRGVFGFLAVAGMVVLGMLVVVLPETKNTRSNSKTEVDEEVLRRERTPAHTDGPAKKQRKFAVPNPFASLRLLGHRPAGLILLSNGLVFASYYSVTAGIPVQFERLYGFKDIGIGLVFLPAGVGSLVSAAFCGKIMDWNYRRVQREYQDTNGAADGNGTRKDTEFHIERARLQIGGPMALLSALALLLYGVVLDLQPPLAVSLALIFLVSFSITASYNVMNVLLVDLYYSTPATVMATNNFVRCFLGAASTALVTPMVERFGNGRTYSVVSAVIVAVCCPILGMAYANGVQWRVQRDQKQKRSFGVDDGTV